MEQVGASGSERLRLADAVERAERVVDRQAHPRPRDQHLHVAAHPARQLVGQRRGVGCPAERQQRADLAQRRVGVVGIGGAGLPVALQRLAVEPALGEDVAQEHRRRRLGRAARGGAGDLGQGEVEQPLADVVPREVERVTRRGRDRRRLRARA